MDRVSLRPYDGVAIVSFLILPPLFSTGLSTLVEQNHAAVWMALLLGLAIMLCLFLFTDCLMKKYEGRNIIEITSRVMGKPLGRIYGILLCVYFCFNAGIHIRESAEILKAYDLSLTPLFVIAGLFLLAAAFMNFLGGRPIVKSAGFFLPLIVLGTALILLLGLNRYRPDQLAPLLGNGPSAIAQNGLFMTSLFDGVMVLFIFAPAFSSSTSLRKAGLWALVFTAALYLLVSVCYIMTFPPVIGSRMVGGLLEMAKSIYYNHFFYRFEAIVILPLVFAFALAPSISLFIARESLACSFGHAPRKIMTILCSLPVGVAVFLPANLLDLTKTYLPIIREYSAAFLAGLPLLVLTIGLIKGRVLHEKN